MLKDRYIHTLTDLGLTLVQAKTYLALCKLDTATIKMISKASSLARQDIYRIMPALQKMGLTEKIIANPTKYKATPIRNGIAHLLQNKEQEQKMLHKKTAELLKNLQEDAFRMEAPAEEEPQMLVISELSLLVKRLMDETNASEISIDSMGTWESFEGITAHGLADFKKALRRGVRIRAITEKPPSEKAIPPYLKTLQKHPLYEVRFVSPPSPVTMSIIDKKELNICISTTEERSVSSLCSNNPVIVGLALNYFEEIWSKASTDKKGSTRKRAQFTLQPPKEKGNHAPEKILIS